MYKFLRILKITGKLKIKTLFGVFLLVKIDNKGQIVNIKYQN
jgi:hypothetical protein